MDQTRTIMFPVPTSTSTAGTDSFGRGTSPSLYLIIFLTLILLLICSSLSIFLRGFIQRRRLRNEIQQAIDRGDLSAGRGSELIARLDTMTWSLGRWSLTWVRMLREDLASGGQSGGDPRAEGRWRKKGRVLSRVPKLHEVAYEGMDGRVGNGAGLVNEMRSFQPFALFHRTTAPINDPLEDRPRHIINYNINVPPSQAIRISGAPRHCTCPPGSTSQSSERCSSGHSHPSSRVGLGNKRESLCKAKRHPGETWIDRISDPSLNRDETGHPRSFPLEASFLIKLPEPDEDRIFRNRVKEQEGEEVLHAPMEIGILKGVLRGPRR